MRHNEIRDVIANLLSQVCHNDNFALRNPRRGFLTKMKPGPPR